MVSFETIASTALASNVNQRPDALADHGLLQNMSDFAHETFSTWSSQKRAAAALHLLLDSVATLESNAYEVIATATPAALLSVAEPDPSMYAASEPAADVDTLPDALKAFAELAFAYLGAGMHVLLAGAPGTGKTQIAQFIASAWNRKASHVDATLRHSDRPTIAVANSSWSPFHTIGGLVPDGNGAFVPSPGVFMDPLQSKASGQWSLRDGALVLDEMNRADLDRAIGELYPMLSGNVNHVTPAGLPGVTRITIPDRFRIVATINDAKLDDVVFPISQGLARRFVRIELPGAKEDDVHDFVNVGGDKEYIDAAKSAVAAFFTVARERELCTVVDDDARVPFGVGWFLVLRRWAERKLVYPDETEGREKEYLARRALIAGLRSAVKTEGKLLEALQEIDIEQSP